jgi:aspartyl-tRNA(Asn)/glutamyl-tRNA(Gln) amidotransferase subunit C
MIRRVNVKITNELIEHLEDLSKLELTDAEIEKMKIDMAEILEYMKMLDGIDVKGYNPAFTPIKASIELRKDLPHFEDPSRILELIPKMKDKLVSVPSIYAK